MSMIITDTNKRQTKHIQTTNVTTCTCTQDIPAYPHISVSVAQRLLSVHQVVFPNPLLLSPVNHGPTVT